MAELPDDVFRFELERRRREEPLRYVKLNKPSEQYAREVLSGSYINLFAAANGIGKTRTTIAALGWLIWPEQCPTEFRDCPLVRQWPWGDKNKKIRFISTPKEMEEIGGVQSAIRELWPVGQYQALKGKKTYPSIYKANGFEMDMMTYDQHPDEFEGATIPIQVFNEPPPEEIYKRCVSRTRGIGKLMFPMTPLTDAAWIKDKIYDRADGKRIVVIHGDIEDACIEHGVNGHYTHEQIQNMLAEYDPDELEARAHGRFMHLSGLIFRNFNRGTHVAAKPIEPVAGWPKVMVIDPAGLGKPFSVIWAQVSPQPMHSIQVIREWPDGSQGELFERMKDSGKTVEEYAALFDRMERDMGVPKDSVTRIMDRRYGHIRDPRFGRTLREHFGDHGFFFQDSYSTPDIKTEVETGIQIFKNYLKVEPISKLPCMSVSPTCVNFIRAVERWGRDPDTQKPKDDVWKNFCDCGRYLCASEPKFEFSVPEQEWNNPGGIAKW